MKNKEFQGENRYHSILKNNRLETKFFKAHNAIFHLSSSTKTSQQPSQESLLVVLLRVQERLDELEVPLAFCPALHQGPDSLGHVDGEVEEKERLSPVNETRLLQALHQQADVVLTAKQRHGVLFSLQGKCEINKGVFVSSD